MRKYLSIGTSAAVAAVFTHGLVLSAMDLNESLPIWTYQGFFQHLPLATDRLKAELKVEAVCRFLLDAAQRRMNQTGSEGL